METCSHVAHFIDGHDFDDLRAAGGVVGGLDVEVGQSVVGEDSIPLPQSDAVDARAVTVGDVGGEIPAERRAQRHVRGTVIRRDSVYFTRWSDKVCNLERT